MNRSPLKHLANPTSIALFGASPHPATLGGELTANIMNGGFGGRLILINPRHAEISGQPCLPSLEEVSGVVDLALIAVPASEVLQVIGQCGQKRVKSAVVYSAGFSEIGGAGAEREAELIAAAKEAGIRLMGPRALGFIRPHQGLNATPFRRALPGGNLAFVSQSGSVCTGILDWVFSDDFALSAVFSPGSGGDIDLPEILDFLATDVRTESILLYLEGVKRSRRFMSALRAAARSKPVVVAKSGRTAGSAGIAQAHSQAPVGDDTVFDAAMRRAGALRVRSIGDLFSAARALTSPHKPHGKRLVVISNGGGPAVVAADAAAESGIELATLSATAQATLRNKLPLSWAMDNPVDLLIDAGPERFAVAIGAALEDKEVDGVLVIMSPGGFVSPLAIAEILVNYSRTTIKPLLACWMGESSVREARRLLANERIPLFRSPESAVTAFSFMVNFVRNQKLLLETPASLSAQKPADISAARALVNAALMNGQRTLDESATRHLLAAFHIELPTKPEPPGESYREMRITIRRDPTFGPVIGVGEGGSASEIHDRLAVALPPLNDRLISDLFREPLVARLLAPSSSKPPVAREPLKRLLMRISELACELPWIDHLEINPLIAYGTTLNLGPTRITLRTALQDRDRYAHMAICPYPTALETQHATRSGLTVTIRPIRPEDASAFQEFVRGLSNRSRYYRFFQSVRELPAQQLARRTQIDYDREMVLVATVRRPNQAEQVVGEANYGVLPDGITCEFAVVIADQLAGQGLGSCIMNCLMAAARERGLTRMIGEVLSDNEPMQAMMASLGFTVAVTDDPETLELSRKL